MIGNRRNKLFLVNAIRNSGYFVEISVFGHIKEVCVDSSIYIRIELLAKWMAERNTSRIAMTVRIILVFLAEVQLYVYINIIKQVYLYR